MNYAVAPPTITIDVRGPVGSGKTAIASAIATVLLRVGGRLEIDVSGIDDIETGGDVRHHVNALEVKPKVVITETVEPRKIERPAALGMPYDLGGVGGVGLREGETAARLTPMPRSAPDILRRAAQHMQDRAAARDQPGGERSMARTVQAFNALCGTSLSERDGWMFMAVLKAARATANDVGVSDDYEDGAAYFALAGESVNQEKKA